METIEPTGEIRVLIAEDEALVAALTRSMLRSLGYSVVGTAADGEKAVALTRELKPAVVLMDIEMPLADGLKAAASIQETCPTPVVILSAHREGAKVDEAALAGVGAFLVKPPRPEELERAITIAIARHAELMESKSVSEQLKKTLAEVKLLSGLLPICCSCKKIRDDHDSWSEIESYVAKRTDARFSHTYCPECLQRLYPEFSGP